MIFMLITETIKISLKYFGPNILIKNYRCLRFCKNIIFSRQKFKAEQGFNFETANFTQGVIMFCAAI